MLLFIIKGVLSRTQVMQTSYIIGLVVLLKLLIILSCPDGSLSVVLPFLLTFTVLSFLYLYRVITKKGKNEMEA